MSTTRVVSYLDNPAGRAHKSSRKGKTKRRPPAGWSSWKAYMAHIRGKKGASATRTNPGGRKRSGRKRRATSRRPTELLVIPFTKRKTKRNPAGRRHAGGMVGRVVGHVGHVVISGAEAIGGELLTRGGRSLVTKHAPGTIVASVWEVLIALTGGAVLGRFNENLGEYFAVGGIMAPMRSALQAAGVPWVSSTLGDDGFRVGPGTGVMLVSAHPGDYLDAVNGRQLNAGGGDLADYVTGPGAQVGDYVTGPGSQLMDYVTGPDAL